MGALVQVVAPQPLVLWEAQMRILETVYDAAVQRYNDSAWVRHLAEQNMADHRATKPLHSISKEDTA